MAPPDWTSGAHAADVDLDRRRERTENAIGTRVSAEAYGLDDFEVREVAVVNEGPNGEPIVVPVVRFDLGTTEVSPDSETVWRLAAEAVRAAYEAFEGVFVRHYDVEFGFDGEGLFDRGTCRRIAVTDEVAKPLVTEPGYGVDRFRAAMIDAHDLDDEVAPVAWGVCRDYGENGTGAGF